MVIAVTSLVAVRVAWEASKATEAKIAVARTPEVEKGGRYPGGPTPAQDTDSPTGGNDQAKGPLYD